MKLQFIPDARKFVWRLWSSKLLMLSMALIGLEIVLPLFETSFPRNVFLGLSAITSMASFAAKFFIQTDPRSDEAKTQHIIAAMPADKQVDFVAVVSEPKKDVVEKIDAATFEYESGL